MNSMATSFQLLFFGSLFFRSRWLSPEVGIGVHRASLKFQRWWRRRRRRWRRRRRRRRRRWRREETGWAGEKRLTYLPRIVIREECKLHKSNWLRLETWEVSEPKLQEEGKEEIYKLSRKSYVLVSAWSLKDNLIDLSTFHIDSELYLERVQWFLPSSLSVILFEAGKNNFGAFISS